MKIKTALIVDNLTLTEWQKRALSHASDIMNIEIILNCQNTYTKKKFLKHFGYYLINIIALRNHLTRRSKLDFEHKKVISFSSLYDGDWQTLPKEVLHEIEKREIKLIIKFGMSLLHINEATSKFDILSFHHGDPEKYRGRPAGFYEILNNEERLGLIVQKLSNKIDGGSIYAKAYAKITHHSYKKTAINFFLKSEFLLRKAIQNYLDQSTCNIRKLGQPYQLPANTLVFFFLLSLAKRKLLRFFYGAFIEKKWNIIKFKKLKFDGLNELSLSSGFVPNIYKKYSFYADPFFSPKGDFILVEAMNSKNGLGEIIQLAADSLEMKGKLFEGAHYSYPFTLKDSEIDYILPEVASHSSPYIFSLSSEHQKIYPLEGLEKLRLIDSTIIKHDGNYFLFGGQQNSSSDCLFLFYSKNLLGPYKPHPKNPIVMDPKVARMGGRILKKKNRLIRFGQNNCFGYGQGLFVNEISKLSLTEYDESCIGVIGFKDVNGPHTIDFREDMAILDFYIEELSILAGYRRFASRVFKQLTVRKLSKLSKKTSK